MQAIQLTAHHYKGVGGPSVIEIDGLPRLGAVLTTHQMRQLARQLNQIANDADQGATGTIQYPVKD